MIFRFAKIIFLKFLKNILKFLFYLIEISEPRHRFEEYIYKMSQYKFGLDLLGVGEPNKRTFEILSCNTLMISQKGNLDWGFEEGDDFSDETVFSGDNVDELFYKIQILINNDVLYNKCLQNQSFWENLPCLLKEPLILFGSCMTLK